MKNGYVRLMIENVAKFEHQWVAEQALGRPLPAHVEVHHLDYNRANNMPGNLVVCPDARYHDLLHQRTDALNAGAPAHWRKCRFCKAYGDPELMFVNQSNVHHRACINLYYREKRAKR